MEKLILVKIYAQGLAGALGDDAEFAAVSRELAEFQERISRHAALKEILASPFVAARKKTQIIQDILAAWDLQGKTRRLILLLLENSRLHLLGDILEELPALWNERRGVTTFEVSSVVSLGEGQKEKLQEKLERLEGRPVFLRCSIDPGLLAGFSLKKGNLIYDASIKGHLAKIKERISEG
ncbi:MAG: ATP synthase F1 subunit delta [Candidatus Aminicenantales bacterium]